MTPIARRLAALAAATGAVSLIAACSLSNPPPPIPPQRPMAKVGTANPAYAAAARYLAAHPATPGRGMQVGILISSGLDGYVCLGYCHTWHGIVVVEGGYVEHLTSSQGDNGMAQLVQPGDEFEFARGGDVEAPSDEGGGSFPSKVIVAGAVKV